MTYLLVECTDCDVIYRILHFKDTKLTHSEIQDAIYEIKNKFYDEDYDGWLVEDVLNILAEKYDFEEYTFDGYLEI